MHPIKCSIVDTFTPNSLEIVVFNEVFETFVIHLDKLYYYDFRSILLKYIPVLGGRF